MQYGCRGKRDNQKKGTLQKRADRIVARKTRSSRAVNIFKRLALEKRRTIMILDSEQMHLSALASTWLFELSKKFIN